MTYLEFKEIVDLLVYRSQKITKTLELGIDVLEFTEDTSRIITKLLAQLLTPEGLDWFEWFMYEKGAIEDGVGDVEMKAYHTVNGEKTEIIKTLEELYEYLVLNNYIKCKTEL
jgi:hypothetical protein